MKVLPILSLGRWVPLFLIVVLSFVGFSISEENSRVKRAQEELENAKQVLAETTNDVARTLWTKKVDLAERELSNARRLTQLEDKEKDFSSRRRTSVEYALREALAAIVTDTQSAERRIQEQNDIARKLKAARIGVVQLLEATGETTEADTAIRASAALRLRNLDAEIQACVLEREVAEMEMRLAREAGRVETERQKMDLNPRPTIRLLVQKGQSVSDARRGQGEFEAAGRDLEVKSEETDGAIKLAEERFSHLDEEIAILDDRCRVERKSRSETEDKDVRVARERRIRSMLSVAQSEKEMLQQFLRHLRVQRDALGRNLGLVRQTHALYSAEAAYLENDLGLLKSRFYRQLLTPLALVSALVFLYWLISSFLFPRAMSKDSLFVTRRMGGYVVAMLVVLLLVAFFLEDLKAIATVMGIVGAAIVIALQDFCSCFAGWFAIVGSRKVKLGDRVEIDGNRGDVIDMQILRITLLELNNWLGIDEPTGRVLIIPNNFIFKSPVFNYSHIHPYIWGKLDITVTFETPAKEAHELLFRVLEEETRQECADAAHGENQLEQRYTLASAACVPKIHTTIADSGVCFSLFFVAHCRKVNSTRTRISKRILEEFEKNPRLQFAYPTERHIPTPERGGFAVSVASGSQPKG